MKYFIVFSVALLSVVYVNGDVNADFQALLAKKTAEYMKLTEPEVKTHATANVAAVKAMMNKASAMYLKNDETLVADVYAAVEKYVDEGLPRMFANIDNITDAKVKAMAVIQVGVTVEAIKFWGEVEEKKRAATPLKVTETLAVLEKKYKDIVQKIMTLTKWTVEELTKKKSLFWADVHQKIYVFLETGIKDIDAGLKDLKSDAIRAKNLNILVEDLTLFLKVADTRPKQTLFQKVSSKFSEYAAKAYSSTKTFLAKINPF